MRFPLDRRLLLATGLVAVLIAVGPWWGFRNLYQLQKLDGRVTRAYEMREAEVELTQRLVDAESNIRGYLLARDVTSLERLQAARALITEALQKLQSVASENPELPSRLRRVEQLSESFLQRLSAEIQIQSPEPQQLKDSLRDIRQMTDELRAQVTGMESIEDAVLMQRKQLIHAAYQFAMAVVVISFLISLAAFGAAVILVKRDMRSREECAAQVEKEREQLRVTLSSIGDGVIATDTQHCITWMNPIAELFTGWQRGNAIGRRLEEVFQLQHETPGTPFEPERRVDSVAVVGGYSSLRAQTGLDREISSSTAKICDDAGEVQGTVLVFRDVSAERQEKREHRIRAELNALRAEVSTALASGVHLVSVLSGCCDVLQNHLAGSAVGFWLLDNTQLNLELQAVAQCPQAPGDLLRKMASHLDLPEQTLSTETLLQSSAQEKSATIRDWTSLNELEMSAYAGFPLRVDGQPFGVLAIYSRIGLHDNALETLVPVAELLALWIDRHRVTAAREEVNELFHALSDSIPQLVWMSAADGSIEWFNRRWHDFTGSELTVPTPIDDVLSFVHPDEAPRVRTSLRYAMLAGAPWEDTFRAVDAHGELHWILSRMVPVKDHDGKPVRWFGTATDISAQLESQDALSRSEANLRRVIDSMFTFVCILAPEGKIIETNRAPLEAARVVREEVVGRQIWELPWWAGDRPARERLIAAVAAARRGLITRYDTSVGTGGAAEATIDLMMQPVFEAGSLVFIILSAVDVTDRKQVENELAASQEFLRSSIDALDSHLAVVDANCLVLAVNDAWKQFATDSGLPCEMHGVGQNYLEIFSQLYCRNEAADFQPILECIQDVLHHGREFAKVEYRYDVGGVEHWFQMRVNRFKGSYPQRVVIAHQEITDRVQAEQATLHRSEQLMDLAKIATQLNSTHDTNSVLGIVTAGARTILGAHCAVSHHVEEEDWSRSLTAAAFSDEYADWREGEGRLADDSICKIVVEQNRPLRLSQTELEAMLPQDRVTGKSGRKGQISNWLAAPLTTHDNRCLGLIEVAERFQGDFTFEDELTLIQLAQMGSVALENVRLYDNLVEADQRKDQFLATLAHELRNPLFPLTTAAALLQSDFDNPLQVRELSSMISRQSEQLKQLIDDLLDVSRISTGKLHLRIVPVAMQQVLASALDISRPVIELAQHELVILQPEQPVFVDGDPVRLAQVGANLIINAAKYTPEGGKITLTLRSEGISAVLSVADTGIGIPAEMLTKIFSLFSQVDSSHTRSRGGLGIGLTLVKTLVSLHGGHVEATSAGLSQGSEFVVTLPLSQNHSNNPPVTASSDPLPLPNLKIVIVDDNQTASYLLGKLLEKLKQDVRIASTGAAALELVREFQPDIFISDIAMPGLSGYELARLIRDEQKTPSPFLVALTGYGQASDREAALKAGFNEHLVKPIGIAALQQLLRSIPR